MSEKPRRAAAEIYNPPHRQRVAQEQPKVAATPTIEHSQASARVVHAWEVPASQPQQIPNSKPEGNGRSSGAPSPKATPSPVPRIIHAWETAEAKEVNTSKDRQSRSQDRSQGRGGSRSPGARNSYRDGTNSLNLQDDAIQQRHARHQGKRNGRGGASAPVTRAPSRNRSTSRHSNRRVHRRGDSDAAYSPPERRTEDLLSPEHAEQRSRSPRHTSVRLVQPWEVQEEEEDEEEGLSSNLRTGGGSSIFSRLGPPPPKGDAGPVQVRTKPSKPAPSIRSVNASSDRHGRTASAPVIPTRPVNVPKPNQPSAPSTPNRETVAVTTKPAQVKIDFGKLVAQSVGNWADDDEDFDYDQLPVIS
ncbi:hypothetical protein DFJ77DRAFT_16130 [Powellomyces hirtus]|nr:hypothetical protein DFJ77DRAFT_16130 [Powellomyces hirtus]